MKDISNTSIKKTMGQECFYAHNFFPHHNPLAKNECRAT